MWPSLTTTTTTTTMTFSLLALSIGNALAAPAAQSTLVAPPTASVKNGTYVGRHEPSYNQDFFLGIPYAQPPVGNLRFRQAQSLNTSWTDAREATQYSKECVGYGGDQVGYDVSEDCLYLNVIRPAGYEGQALPVAFWIHGGGFYMGGAPDHRYNLSFIVENSVKIGKPIMAVSTNYRLAGWGFLYSDEIKGAGLTNIGVRDQRLALHWIQENIAAFGGDPKKVAIWGESAGAASVGVHLVAYGGRDDGLFRAAIMESGNPIYYGSQTTTNTQAAFNNVTKQAGCADSLDPLQCLREVSFDQLNSVLNTTGLVSGPVIDGDLLRGYGSLQLRRGEFVKVPIIDGANSDEGAGFAARPVNSTDDFKSITLAGLPSTLVEALVAAYPDDLSTNILASMGNTRPGADLGYQFRRAATYSGDYVFIAPRRQTCASWAANGLTAFCYRFNAIPAGLSAWAGVSHFQEVAFVFNNVQGLGYALNPFDGKPQSYLDLSTLMSASWASFVHDLDPNGWTGRQAGVPAWPAYDLANPQAMVWDANVTSFVEQDTYRKEGMALINDNAAGVYHR